MNEGARRSQAGPLVLRSESWGGLLLDQRHDRIWGFGGPEFAALSAAVAGRSLPSDRSPSLDAFLNAYGPEAPGKDNPYLWDSEYFFGPLPARETCKLQAPISVSWSITNRCQSTCGYCCTSSHPKAHPGGTYEAAVRSIDLLAQWGALRLIVGGGEPLLRDDILQVLEHARARGLRPTIATNGLSLLEMDVASLANAVMLVQVSLDSLEEPVYRLVRGTRGGAATVTKAIRELCRLGIPVRVVTVLTRHNERHLEALANFLSDEGVGQWFVFLVQPSGRAAIHFERHPPLDFSGAVATLAELDARHPALSISLWGAQAEDQLAVTLDSQGDLSLHHYGTGSTETLLRLDMAEPEALETIWARVSPEAQWTTLVNFTRASRRISRFAEET